mmetsp:Transcript_16943/g.28236  ORF Transcript_16943/g.28236 Transcript_16943/m.28236 type:complete len:92 (+) Transcript_16943:130-405(+)
MCHVKHIAFCVTKLCDTYSALKKTANNETRVDGFANMLVHTRKMTAEIWTLGCGMHEAAAHVRAPGFHSQRNLGAWITTQLFGPDDVSISA